MAGVWKCSSCRRNRRKCEPQPGTSICKLCRQYKRTCIDWSWNDTKHPCQDAVRRAQIGVGASFQPIQYTGGTSLSSNGRGPTSTDLTYEQIFEQSFNYPMYAGMPGQASSALTNLSSTSTMASGESTTDSEKPPEPSENIKSTDESTPTEKISAEREPDKKELDKKAKSKNKPKK